MANKILKFEDEKTIFRFLNLDGFLKTLGINENSLNLNSTFLLRSCRYYQELEKNQIKKDYRADKYENSIFSFAMVNGKQQGSVSGSSNPVLISSWSIITEEKLSESINLPFPERHFAIKSDVKSVKEIVVEIAEKLSGIPHANPSVEHGKIEYYSSENNSIVADSDVDFSYRTYAFHKLKNFSAEEEYRFAVGLNCIRNYGAKFLEDKYGLQMKVHADETKHPNELIAPVKNINYIKAVYIKKDAELSEKNKERINQVCETNGIKIYEY